MNNKINNQQNKLPKKIHFIGCGGAGMFPLANICLDKGIQVTGSDREDSDNLQALKQKGAYVWFPHEKTKLEENIPDICIRSTAITDENEELTYLKKLGITIWHRSDLLEQIANSYEKQIVISGTHGKTTTTAMIAWILEEVGMKPSWVLGGKLNNLGTYNYYEDSAVFIFEGDESDQSFLKSNPYIGVITSLEADHLENYQNSFEVQTTKFKEFATKCNKLILHHNVEALKDNATYLYSSDGWRKNDTNKIHWEIQDNDIQIDKAPGHHNKQNAIAAILVAKELGISVEDSVRSLSNFPGIYRRFELIGSTKQNIKVYDDYAHHPTEVAAAISAGKQIIKEQGCGKLIVLFQPHLPTRLRDLWKEFCDCFNEADYLLLTDLYVARGKALEGITSQNLAKNIHEKNTNLKLKYIEGKAENLIVEAQKLIQKNDIVLILGAGNITFIREKLFKLLSSTQN